MKIVRWRIETNYVCKGAEAKIILLYPLCQIHVIGAIDRIICISVGSDNLKYLNHSNLGAVWASHLVCIPPMGECAPRKNHRHPSMLHFFILF